MTSSSDPLDLFFKVSASDLDLPDEALVPGAVPPKNRGSKVDTASSSWLNDLPGREYLVNGSPQKFYTIGSLARALGKSAVTIRSWESKGWLPAPAYRTPPPRSPQLPGNPQVGRRLYSSAQVEFLVKAAQAFNIGNPKRADWDSFRRTVARDYPTT
jgi:hypothetical protein